MEIGPEQQIAFALAGTVALPSPYPCFGRVTLLEVPAGPGVLAETYFKVIQLQGPKHLVTRVVKFSDVRTIQAPPEGQTGGDPECWPYLLPDAIAAKIKAARSGKKAAQGPDGEVEFELFAAAIVFVPEAAPVLQRNECGVTAAVSAESMAFYLPSAPLAGGGCCFKVEPPWGEL